MPPFLRSRPALVGLVVAAVALGLVGFVPLFGGPGYESALGAGVILPTLVAVVVAFERAGSSPVDPFEALVRGVADGAAFAALAFLITLLHGLRVGFCDALAGSAHFALGPGVGALMAGAWGACAGEIVATLRRRRGGGAASRWRRALGAAIAIGIAAAGPVGAILVSLGRFYTSPMVFAYDPFFGYFSGTLYDTVVDFSGLVTYRAGSAASLIAAFAIAHHLGRGEGGGIVLRRGRPATTVLGAAALVGSVTVTALGDRLGHWQTADSIARTLGARLSGERCDLIYPRSMRPADAARFARECDAFLAEGERWFGAPGPARVTAFLFSDAAQKGALMGAYDTYIAKPWRREVYLQSGGYPPPVLGHELVHVFAGAFARGPFRVAGGVGGLLPDPGLIEGVAVAASPPEGDLTPREWSKAMKDLGLLPPLHRLFTVGFLGQNASTAYTVSGAFVGYVHDRFGPAAIRAWYGGASLADATGQSWADLERDFHADLDRAALPEAARTQAKARFDRPAIFGRRCPHVVDACKEKADRLRGSGDDEGAVAEYARALALDPNDWSPRLGIARARLHQEQVDEGRRDLEKIAADPRAPRHLRDRAIEELGDLALGTGRPEEALARYGEIFPRIVDEDRLRTLEVKMNAARSPRARASTVALLTGRPGTPPDRGEAMELLGAWSAAAPDDGIPLYLLGRQYANAGRFADSAERLGRALAGSIPIARVRIETERLQMVNACALGDAGGAARFFEAYAAHPEVSTARREAARELVARCRRATGMNGGVSAGGGM